MSLPVFSTPTRSLASSVVSNFGQSTMLRSSTDVDTLPRSASALRLFQRETIGKELSTVNIAETAVKALQNAVMEKSAQTLMELRQQMLEEVSVLLQNYLEKDLSYICTMFISFITKNITETNVEIAKRQINQSANTLFERIHNSTSKIIKFAYPFVSENSKILFHGDSDIFLPFAKELIRRETVFDLYITCCEKSTQKSIQKAYSPFPVFFVSHLSVGSLIHTIDSVFVGAHSIAQSGGIINTIGTFQIAILAREFRKPFYVLSESFRFDKSFPLDQSDIKQKNETIPTLDYTPPQYIALLFTELGVFSPAAVSDELIKVYN